MREIVLAVAAVWGFAGTVNAATTNLNSSDIQYTEVLAGHFPGGEYLITAEVDNYDYDFLGNWIGFDTLADYWPRQINGVSRVRIVRADGGVFAARSITAEMLFNGYTLSYTGYDEESGLGPMSEFMSRFLEIGYSATTSGGGNVYGSLPIVGNSSNVYEFGSDLTTITALSLSVDSSKSGDPCTAVNLALIDPLLAATRFCELGYIDPESPLDYYSAESYFSTVGRNVAALQWTAITVSDPAPVSPVPVPASSCLLALALTLLGAMRRRVRAET